MDNDIGTYEDYVDLFVDYSDAEYFFRWAWEHFQYDNRYEAAIGAVAVTLMYRGFDDLVQGYNWTDELLGEYGAYSETELREYVPGEVLGQMYEGEFSDSYMEMFEDVVMRQYSDMVSGCGADECLFCALAMAADPPRRQIEDEHGDVEMEDAYDDYEGFLTYLDNAKMYSEAQRVGLQCLEWFREDMPI